MTTTRVHYIASLFFGGQAACGRYVDSISTIVATESPAYVTCLACKKAMGA